MPCSSMIVSAIAASIGCMPVETVMPASRFEVPMMSLAAVRGAPRLPDVRLAQVRGAGLSRDGAARLSREVGRSQADFAMRTIVQQQTDDWWATTGAGLLAVSLSR